MQPVPPTVSVPLRPIRPRYVDRASLIAHLVWEVLLLILCIALALAVAARQSQGLTQELVGALATTGIQAVAVAVSLRTRQPNLAVTAIAVGASIMVAELVGRGWALLAAAAVAIVASLVLGLIAGLVAALTRAPGWVVSLGVLAFVAMLSLWRGVTIRSVTSTHLPHHPRTYLDLIVVVLVVGSLAGGVLWQLAPLRRALGVDTSPGDPSMAPLGSRLLGALIGFGVSSALAAVSGVAFILYTNTSYPISGAAIPLVPLAVVLLGGVSIFGGRGGVAGTLLASIAVGLFVILMQLHNFGFWTASDLPAFVGIVIGIGVSLLFGVFETRRPPVAGPWIGAPTAPLATSTPLAAPSTAPDVPSDVAVEAGATVATPFGTEP